ncbi:MAG TPA: peroxiredoxin [Gammaproteobacteria bacterium]|nr:peroxiredoxin [Gammaproteobacteria bacterium]
MLQTDQPAPAFELPDADMTMVTLGDYAGNSNVVLYFYPKDDTPGCTTEAIDFTNLSDEFARLNTAVLGVSRDDCTSHAAFVDKHGLNVRLLADTDGEVCERYGVWQEKEKNGVKKMGIVRSTFIIDKAGIVREALYGVNAQGHARDVLARVAQLA